jgi:phenylpyruvate tautomerase PptA (4-oxalocrotonate tautomerase family)
VLEKASQLVAHALNKPEDYVMVSLEPAAPMMFAGKTAPAAFLELRAIGLPVGKTAELSRVLCGFAETELGIAQDRVFINFADVPAQLWGWNSDIF